MWLDGRNEIAAIGGSYAWRTRLSDLRRAPFLMRIDNRQRTVKTPNGRITISEYRFNPDGQAA